MLLGRRGGGDGREERAGDGRRPRVVAEGRADDVADLALEELRQPKADEAVDEVADGDGLRAGEEAGDAALVDDVGGDRERRVPVPARVARLDPRLDLGSGSRCRTVEARSREALSPYLASISLIESWPHHELLSERRVIWRA